MRRVDGAGKSAGRLQSIHDLERPGMLFGKVRFSDHAHAKIVNIDTSKAERLPGVRAVVTGYNTPEVRFGFLRDNLALKKYKVRQFRDEIAAVAAIDPDIAEEAVSLIEVEYEPLTGVFCPQEALLESAPLVHETDVRGRPRKSNRLPLDYHHESGDLQAGLQASKFVVEGSYSTQLIQQSCMGTAGCIAEFDLNGRLTIWTKTQIPFLAQREFNQALQDMGLREVNSRVCVPDLGGGFGTGLDTHAYEYIAMLLAHATNRPIKIVYNREEEFACLSPRQSSQTHISQGCDENGRLTFRKVEVLLDNGAYTSWGATYPTVMMLPATSLYRVGNVFFDAQCVYTNNTYCQAMRGYGNPEMTWAIESNMDELAEEAGIDPLELRLINCNQPGEITPMGCKVTSCGLEESLHKVAWRLDWKNRRSRGKRRGVGLACLCNVGGSGRIYRSDASGIMLKLDDFANVNVYYGGVEMGQGLHTVLTQTIAESLGVEPHKVIINPTDTGTCPWDVGTHASRGTFVACNAALMAVARMREKLFTHATELLPALIEKNREGWLKKNPGKPAACVDQTLVSDPNRYLIEGGILHVRGGADEPWMRVELGQLLRAIHFRTQGTMLTAEAFYDPPNELPNFNKGIGNISATYAYGTQGASVEVDTDTGEVKIIRMAAAHDVGKVLNPMSIRGQINGGLAQGIGYALYEEVSSKEGKILNPDFTDYKIPTIGEMDFPIDLDFIETEDGYGPYGAKGVGEPGLIPTAAAIANAIYDAIGVRIRQLPITPEKILNALREQKKKEE